MGRRQCLHRSPHPEPLLLVSPPMLPHPPGHSSLMGAMAAKVSEGNASALSLKVVPSARGHKEGTVQVPTNQLLRTVVKTPTRPSQAPTPPPCPVLPTEPWRVFWAGGGVWADLMGSCSPKHPIQMHQQLQHREGAARAPPGADSHHAIPSRKITQPAIY